MPSRFNQLIEPNKYVSQYVPLPLELIAAEGAEKQKQFNKSVEEEDALSDLQEKVQALDQVKAFGQTYNVGDKDYANKYFNDLNQELSTKADELAKGDKGSVEYKTWLKKKSRDINKELSTGKLGEINAAYKTYQEQQKALQEAKDLNLSPWRAIEIERSRQGYGVGQGIEGDQRLSTSNVGEYVDRNKELDDLTKGINEELTSLYASPDNQGYIRSGKMEEIKDVKIRNTFRNFLDNSKTKQDIIKEIEYGIANGSINPNNFEKEFANRASAIEEGLVAKYRKSTGTKSLRSDANYLQQQRFNREDAQAVPLATTGESSDYQGLVEDPKYADYVTTDKEGNKSINFKALREAASTGKNPSNWVELGRGIWQGVLDIGSLGFNDGSYSKSKKYEEGMNASSFLNNLQELMKNKAAVIGYTKPVTEENYGEILNQSKDFEVLRGVTIQSDGPVADIQSAELNKSRADYRFFDPSTGVPITKDHPLYSQVYGASDKGVPVSKFRVLKRESRPVDGKPSESVLRVADQAGNIYYVREPQRETTTFYDALSNVNNSGIEYIKNGGKKVIVGNNISQDYNETRVKNIESAIKQSYIDNGADLNSIPKIAAINKDPQGHIAITMSDPNNLQSQWVEQYYVKKDKNGKDVLSKIMFQTENGIEDHLPLNRYMSYKDRIYKTSVYGGALRKQNKAYDPADFTNQEETVVEEGE